MNGNDPYMGRPGGSAGTASETVPELSVEQREMLRREVEGIVTRTRSYLPDGYQVGSELSPEGGGPLAIVAVEPPAGRPVSADFSPPVDDLDTGLDETDAAEVARGLAASAAIQAMDAIGGDVPQTGR